jgi:16S rRNA (cytidine1402-2'-O)-methyltransferase
MHNKPVAKSNASPTLYVVATPIGNLADMSARATDRLAQVSVIACEDTRTSQVLLQHYGITTPTVSFHEHNRTERLPELLARLAKGESIALISDAGTPLISDPGAELVKAVWDAGFIVTPIPGASAAMTALSAAGLPSDGFFFAGFLPTKPAARQARIALLRALPVTSILYEAPHRIAATLEELSLALGEREAVIARELTKRFETFYRGSLKNLAAKFAGNPTKGEIVLLIAPTRSSIAPMTDNALIDQLLSEALTRLPKSAAAAEIAKATGLPREEIYARALAQPRQK